MLKEFAKKHPNSKWRAEAELHEGCYLVYQRKYDEAKPLFFHRRPLRSLPSDLYLSHS